MLPGGLFPELELGDQVPEPVPPTQEVKVVTEVIKKMSLPYLTNTNLTPGEAVGLTLEQITKAREVVFPWFDAGLEEEKKLREMKAQMKLEAEIKKAMVRKMEEEEMRAYTLGTPAIHDPQDTIDTLLQVIAVLIDSKRAGALSMSLKPAKGTLEVVLPGEIVRKPGVKVTMQREYDIATLGTRLRFSIKEDPRA